MHIKWICPFNIEICWLRLLERAVWAGFRKTNEDNCWFMGIQVKIKRLGIIEAEHDLHSEHAAPPTEAQRDALIMILGHTGVALELSMGIPVEQVGRSTLK